MIVGKPVYSNVVRGMNESDAVSDMRNRIRHKIDLGGVPPRRVIITKQNLPMINKSTQFKGVANKGFDDRHLQITAREKLQHNKANSLFNLTPPTQEFLSR
tara:strand:+ start:2274 stop:2576 length:303 start_codon:yes stop_codon:yes gene_type:complete